ncbi:hypothetical protein CHISP_3122 [Chitinispirillum alkaliphilum]|nr:hypothetical protein CHISP_3122 [Chitinispirillum alkaliphilum]
MNKCYFYTFMLIMILSGFFSAGKSFIRFEGEIPASINKDHLEREYIRIWNRLSPDTEIDTGNLYIIFYHHQAGKQYGVRLPEWGGGGAIGTDSIIIPVNRRRVIGENYNQTAVHELVHIVVNRAFGTVYVPRWLHEGLAMVLSGEIPSEGQLLLSRAVWSGKIFSLDTIEYVNRFNASGAMLAYATSHAAVLYLIETYGMCGIVELLDNARGRRSFPSALENIYGVGPDKLNEEIREHIIKSYRLKILSDERYIFALIGILALLAIIVSRFRYRRRLREMAEIESREFSAESMNREDPLI